MADTADNDETFLLVPRSALLCSICNEWPERMHVLPCGNSTCAKCVRVIFRPTLPNVPETNSLADEDDATATNTPTDDGPRPSPYPCPLCDGSHHASLLGSFPVNQTLQRVLSTTAPPTSKAPSSLFSKSSSVKRRSRKKTRPHGFRVPSATEHRKNLSYDLRQRVRQIAEMRSKLAKKQSTIDKLNRKLNEQDAVADGLRSNIDKLSEDMTQMNTQFRQREANLRTEIEEAKRNTLSANKQTSRRDKKIGLLETELDRLHTASEMMKIEIRLKNDTIAELKRAAHDRKFEIDHLSRSYNESSKRLISMEAKVNPKNGPKPKRSTSNNTASEASSSAANNNQQKTTEKEAEVKRLQSVVEHYRAQLDKLNEEYDNQSRKYENVLMNSNRKTRSDCSYSVDDSTDSGIENKTPPPTKDSFDQGGELDSLRTELANAQQQARDHKTRCWRVLTSLCAKEEVIRKLDNVKTDMQEKIDNLRDENRSLQEELSNHKLELKSAKEEIGKLETELLKSDDEEEEEVPQEPSRVTTSYTTNSNYDELEKSYERVCKKLRDLENRHAKMKLMMEKTKIELNTAKEKAKKDQRQIKLLTTKNKKLETKNARLEKQCETEAATKHELDTELMELRSSLNEKDVHMQVLRTASQDHTKQLSQSYANEQRQLKTAVEQLGAEKAKLSKDLATARSMLKFKDNELNEIHALLAECQTQLQSSSQVPHQQQQQQQQQQQRPVSQPTGGTPALPGVVQPLHHSNSSFLPTVHDSPNLVNYRNE